MDPQTLPLFLSATLALLLVPGPAVLYIVARSIDQGRKAGFVSVLGIETANFGHVVAAALGLSAILLSSALAFSVVKYLGAAYLIYLGVRKLLTPEKLPDQSQPPQPQSLRRIYSQGVIVNILNPKTALFFFAFLPQFVNRDQGSATLQIFLFGLIFVAMATFTDGLYALLASSMGSWLKNSIGFLRFERYFAGSVYIGLGVTTALSGAKKH